MFFRFYSFIASFAYRDREVVYYETELLLHDDLRWEKGRKFLKDHVMNSYYHRVRREKAKVYKKSVYTHKRVISVFVGIMQRFALLRARFE
jgi:hypothetical protein